jgi:hypothetical protein
MRRLTTLGANKGAFMASDLRLLNQVELNMCGNTRGSTARRPPARCYTTKCDTVEDDATGSVSKGNSDG